MRPPTRRALTAVLALSLITVPIWAPALDLTGQDYEYGVVELSTTDGKLAFDDDDRHRLDGVDGIDCFDRSFDMPRRCFYDGGALDGNITGVNPSIVGISGPSAGDELTRYTGDEYVMLGDEIYRRTTTFVAANESVGMTVELGVERVDPATALEDVALEAQYVSDGAKAVVRNESTRTDGPIDDTNEILSVDGGYYVVYETASPEPISAAPVVERALEAASLVAGVFLLLRIRL